MTTTRAREVAQRLRDYLEPGDLVVGKRMMRHAMSEAADIIEALLAELEGRGECICARCGIRHGGSILHGGF